MTPADVLVHYRQAAHVQGWFSREAALVCGFLDEVQRSRGTARGGALEIGVHHGRSALFLASLLDRANEPLVVCDVFGASANPSGSGAGDHDVFLSHMRRAFGDLSFLHVYCQPSGTLSRERIGDAFRLIHIDGGHSVEECLSDLRLAAARLSAEGAVVVDDAFRYDWPGVTEALLTFLEDEAGGLVPLLGGFNKLVLVRAGAMAWYGAALAQTALAGEYFPEPWVFKHVVLGGGPYVAIRDPTQFHDLSPRSRWSLDRWLTRRRLRRTGRRVRRG